ncbi:MAG: site-specific DNA-methyltransferase [Alphaproteobacteria bacterium]|nr:site-specific DNA-methyltransferase [Alphaproteobacteria bacterium]
MPRATPLVTLPETDAEILQWIDARGTEPAAGAFLVHTDAFDGFLELPDNSIHAIITDPPYSTLEFSAVHHAKLRRGQGGVWRIPPSFDGAKRRPLPRFTVLNAEDLSQMISFFSRLAAECMRVLVPGGHVFIASNPIICDVAFTPFRNVGLERRAIVTRGVMTFRGGDRPKGAHEEYADLCVMPRSCHEPWGLFRKPFRGPVHEQLSTWGAGALRRPSTDRPMRDYYSCSPAKGRERRLVDHPSLKPQRWMRKLVHAALPMARGFILDPFAGSGSTLAAASHFGYRAIGFERDERYYDDACKAIPLLADLDVRWNRDE